MKNKTALIFTFLITLGVAGSAFANSPFLPITKTGPVRTNEVLSGMAYSNKEGGIQSQIIKGEVRSVNVDKSVFVVEDRHDGITATVLTDSQTIASLRSGNMVTVKLPSGSPVAQSVVIAGSEKRRSDHVAPSGMTYYNKEGGISTQTIVGVVESVNTEKNVFTLKGEGAAITVLTDSQTMTSLHSGQRASVRLQSGSPIALSIAAGM